MAQSVADGFDTLLRQLTPAVSENDAEEVNLSQIERRLETAFDMDYLATYGSAGHGTSITGFSPLVTAYAWWVDNETSLSLTPPTLLICLATQFGYSPTANLQVPRR